MSLSNETVVELSKSFVAARWATDLDNDRIGALEIVEIPALVFFTPSGTYVHRVPPSGRLNAGSVAGAMRQALALSRSSSTAELALRARVLATPASLETLDELSRFLREGYRFADARETELAAYRVAAETGKHDQDRRLAELLFLDLKLRQFGRAREAIKTFVAQYPDSPHRERVEYYRGLRLYHGPNRLDAAVKAWEEQLGKYPGGPWSGKAKGMLRRAQTEQRDREQFGEAVPEVWREKPEVPAAGE